MDDSLNDLRTECDRAAAEFLAIQGWYCSKPDLHAAVRKMLSSAKPATFSMAWLLRQVAKMPAQAQSASRLNDLVQAIATLRAKEAELASTADANHDATRTLERVGTYSPEIFSEHSGAKR